MRTTPRSRFDSDRRASITVNLNHSRSPGRTGAVHRSSSMPGDPIPAGRDR